MSDRIVYTLEEYAISTKLNQQEVLYKILQGELTCCFFSPAILLTYRMRGGVIKYHSQNINLWDLEKMDIFSGFPILPINEIKKILHYGAYSPSTVLVGRHMSIIGNRNDEFDDELLEVSGEAYWGEEPLNLYCSSAEQLRWVLNRDLLIENFSYISRAIEDYSPDGYISKFRNTFNYDDKYIFQKYISISLFKELAEKLNIDSSILNELQIIFKESDVLGFPKRESSTQQGHSISLIDIFRKSEWDILKRFLDFSKDLRDGIIKSNIDWIEINSRVVSVNDFSARIRRYRINHSASIKDDQEGYIDYFRDHYSVELENEEWCTDYDDEILKKSGVYYPPELTKSDLLIFDSNVKPLTLEGDGLKTFLDAEDDEVKIGIVSHLERFTLTQLATDPARKFSVKEIVIKARHVFGAELQDMGEEKLKSIIGASMPQERKRGMKQ